MCKVKEPSFPGASLTFLKHKSAWMIEEEIPKVIAVGIHAGLLAQASGSKELKGLQRAQRRLTFCNSHRAAGH